MRITGTRLDWVGFLIALACMVGTTKAEGDAVGASAADPFSGNLLDAWMTEKGEPVTEGWEYVDGVIHLKKTGKRIGAIVTKREYGDFSLSFEWKIAPGGNSGIKYRVRKYSNRNSRNYGLEYQVLDDLGYPKQPVQPVYRAGALYGLYAPNNSKQLLPVGEFNQGRIVVKNNHIEHWLNGQQVVTADIGNPDWLRRVKASKFDGLKKFGQNTKGRIMLTDHGAEVWYRNFEFKVLATLPHVQDPSGTE
ncbi:MAG: DUF1080 domain-containing protein [Pirellulales bacterium]|nr:DUF1080 domain-containing protein [Pirellulales bacterium]